MSRFEYLSVLISIVIAFGLSEVASNWAHLLRRRRVVRFHWLHAGWSLLSALILVQFWWGFWNFRTVGSWSFAGLLAVVAEALVLVLAVSLLTPTDFAEGDVDLKAHYFQHKRLFFGLGAVLLVLLALVDRLVAGQPFFHPENLVRAAGLGLCAGAAWIDDERAHAGLLAAGLGLFAVFTLVAVQW